MTFINTASTALNNINVINPWLTEESFDNKSQPAREIGVASVTGQLSAERVNCALPALSVSAIRLSRVNNEANNEIFLQASLFNAPLLANSLEQLIIEQLQPGTTDKKISTVSTLLNAAQERLASYPEIERAPLWVMNNVLMLLVLAMIEMQKEQRTAMTETWNAQMVMLASVFVSLCNEIVARGKKTSDQMFTSALTGLLTTAGMVAFGFNSSYQKIKQDKLANKARDVLQEVHQKVSHTLDEMTSLLKLPKTPKTPKLQSTSEPPLRTVAKVNTADIPTPPLPLPLPLKSQGPKHMSISGGAQIDSTASLDSTGKPVAFNEAITNPGYKPVMENYKTTMEELSSVLQQKNNNSKNALDFLNGEGALNLGGATEPKTRVDAPSPATEVDQPVQTTERGILPHSEREIQLGTIDRRMTEIYERADKRLTKIENELLELVELTRNEHFRSLNGVPEQLHNLGDIVNGLKGYTGQAALNGRMNIRGTGREMVNDNLRSFDDYLYNLNQDLSDFHQLKHQFIEKHNQLSQKIKNDLSSWNNKKIADYTATARKHEQSSAVWLQRMNAANSVAVVLAQFSSASTHMVLQTGVSEAEKRVKAAEQIQEVVTKTMQVTDKQIQEIETNAKRFQDFAQQVATSETAMIKNMAQKLHV